MAKLLDTVRAIDEGSSDVRRVYLMKFRFRKGDEHKVLYKIGIAKDPTDRMLQVARSFFMKRRYVPEIQLLRFRKTCDYFKVESDLHKEFKEFNWVFKGLTFDGSTEFFDMCEDKLIERYEEMLPK